jgi:DNA processing protein
MNPRQIQPHRGVSPTEFLGTLNDVEARYSPATLYLRGDAGLLRKGPRVAVIGSRRASAAGIRRAQVLARALVRHDMIVVSGLAAGIDRAAHEAAIEAGGRTIAVIGTSLDESYPKENVDLQARIAREQLLVSQFAPGNPVTRKNFPMRNRTMALLTDATVIVEAGEHSGTLSQAWEALRLGRRLFLLANVAADPMLSWPRELIAYGAEVLSRAHLDDTLTDLPAMTVSHADGFAELV